MSNKTCPQGYSRECRDCQYSKGLCDYPYMRELSLAGVRAITEALKKEEPLTEFTIEYYKDQYEKLLSHNQELTQRVDELKKLVEPVALERIANIISHANSTRLTVIKLLGYLETELRNWATLADKAVSLILIKNIEEVLSPSDDQDDY